MTENSRHLVDQELLPVLDLIGDRGLSTDSLNEARARTEEARAAIMAQADPSVTLTEHHAPGRDGAPPVRLLLYRPSGLSEPTPLVLQIHGGGYVMGFAELGDARNRAWSQELGCAIVAVDYRLAPDAPFPAALEDCYAALEWLHAEGPSLGLDPARIALCGDSAGGGLAAGLALLARERGGPPIRFQLLICPMLDDRTCVATEPNPFTGQFVWTASSNHFGWESWIGTIPGMPDVSPLAAPARAIDLSRLPSTLIATAGLDLFVDENLEYARRLIRAGVPTEVHVVPGAFHGFDAFAPKAEITRRFLDPCKSALQRAFAG